MTGGDALTYDSPWDALLEAAQSRPIGPTANRGLFDDSEVSRLCGIPVCTLDARAAPPPLQDAGQDNPQRGEFLRQQALARNWPYTGYLHWPQVGATAWSSVFMRHLPVSLPGAPPLRHGPQFGNERTLHPPLAHRLSGDLMTGLGVIVLGDQSPAHDANRQDARLISQLHEMFHLLQLRPSSPTDPLLEQVRRERDAENAALTAFQTCCGGHPAVAARLILSHTVDSVACAAPKYFFWPGLGEAALRDGPMLALPLRLQGLYAQAREEPPPLKLQEMWALLVAGVMPAAVYAQHRSGLDRMTAFMNEQRSSGADSVVAGLSSLLNGTASGLQGARRDLARKVVQAARVLSPVTRRPEPNLPRPL